MRRLLILMLSLATSAASAQVVETPVPFDAAGRVMAITPAIAARLELGPPAWRVTGDYVDARLFALGNDGFVVVVTRRNGSVERYSLAPSDRDVLRERVSTLPAQFAVRPDGSVRGAFIRNQSILGLTVYAPAFAGAVTNEAAGRVSSYLLVAGATFFAASHLSREMTITEPMNQVATYGGSRGGLAGAALMYAAGAPDDGQWAGAFVGGLGGAATGIFLGDRFTSGEAASLGFGADAAAITAFLVTRAARGRHIGDEGLTRAEAAIAVAAAVGGMPLGLNYARTVGYNVTAGDIGTLWVTGLLGAGATSILLIDRRQMEPMSGSGLFLDDDGALSPTVTNVTLASGFLLGLLIGDRALVRRFDHSRADAAILGLGAGAGGLIGLGISRMIESDGSQPRLAAALAVAGAAGGLAVTHPLIAPGGDERRFGSLQMHFHPGNAALAASRVDGAFPIISLTF